MGEDLLDVLQLSALLGHQVMVNFQAGGADNFEAAVAEHQIINLLDGARGAVFQGKHPIVTEPVLNGTKHTLEAAEIHHLGVLEEFFTGQLGVGAFHPLTGHRGRRREEVGGRCHSPLNLLAQGGGLGIHGVLIAPADLKEHGPQGIAVLRQLRGQLGGDVRQLGPFPGRVQGGQSLLLLGLAHPGHHVHPLGKGVDQGVVNGINFCSQFL